MPHDQAAQLFADTRQERRGFADYPGTPPTRLEDAYAVQSAAIAIWNRPIGGWKVGRITGEQETELGENRFVGPIFTDDIAPVTPEQMARFPIIAGGFAALEAELIAVIEPPTGLETGEWTEETVLRAIRKWHIGIEVAGSPLKTIGDLGPLASIAGYGNNLGLLVGPELPADVDPDAVSCVATIADQNFGPKQAGALPGGPLAAVAFALRKLGALGYPITPGMLISTGAITGVHEVRVGQECQTEFAPGGCLRCHVQALSGAS